jgi:hypothetical protein
MDEIEIPEILVAGRKLQKHIDPTEDRFMAQRQIDINGAQ